MISLLKRYYIKQSFNPGFGGIFFNPFYFARKGLYANISPIISSLRGKTLDVGCGQKPYYPLYNGDEYIGLEIDSEENRKNKQADFFYDGIDFPFDSKSFDNVISNQVLEHVFNPNEFLMEINRVLSPNGYFLLSVPFVWDEHEQPFDYARYSSFGLTHLLKKNGFEVFQYKKVNNGVEVIFQLISAYLYKVLDFKNIYVRIFFHILLISPFNLIGWVLSKILPRNDDLYLDSVVLAIKVKDV